MSREPLMLSFPVVNNPFDGLDYLIMFDCPDNDEQGGITLERVRVLGVNRNRVYKEFSLSRQIWERAARHQVTFRETDLSPQLVQVPQNVIAGSRIRDPWRVAFPVVNDILVLFVRTYEMKNHCVMHGVRRDGTPVEQPIDRFTFDQANANPTWFIEVEETRAAPGVAPRPGSNVPLP